MAFLVINKVNKAFGKTIAVQDFNLELQKGEFVSFLGPSGCGKTTTLRMVAGFETPTSGRVVINGEDITNKPPNQRDVGMVFQSYALFPNMTVAGNVGYGLRIAKKPVNEIKKRVDNMLDLTHMSEFGDRYPYQLSGGQQQRVALARALALSPQILLLDEPLSALDAKLRVSLRSEIRAIQQELGISAIYVTHDQEEALSISDRVVVMNNGAIEQVGSPFEVYNFPQTSFVANFIGTLNTFSAEIIDPEQCTLKVGDQTLAVVHDLSAKQRGEYVSIAIRPERINFASADQNNNLLEGSIKSVTFLGSIVRVLITCGDNMLCMDIFNNPYLELPKTGQHVQVACPREAVLVLDK
ncbi:MAG: ABC transporter ATP-binding protein [Anaerolineales bacterium]|nr:ABC transporter ATP-binding protein [Anaerolineales bacterium]